MSDEIKFLTGDKALQGGGPEAEALLSSPMVAITPEQLLELAKLARVVKASFDSSISAKMTWTRAMIIKQLRCDLGMSWRAVAEQSFKNWGADATWQPPTNQLAGDVSV